MTNQTNQLPPRGNALSKAIAAFFFKVTGWRVEGSLPNLPKMILIGAPHTTNWDFPLAMNLMYYLGIRLNWMAKKEFFVKPFSYVWNWLGGVPVDRHAGNGMVGQTIEAIKNRANIVLAIAPEGTRTKVNRWRTGFYHIAHGSNIPIVPVLVDYGRKRLTISEPFIPTGDVDTDLPLLQARFKGIKGKNQTHF